MSTDFTVKVDTGELVSAIHALIAALRGNAAPAQAQLQQPVQPAQLAQQVQPAQPAIAQQPPANVPTSAPTCNLEQLAVAATPLIDAGRQAELVDLLSQFGVQALTQLPKERYGEFATALRGLGAKI